MQTSHIKGQKIVGFFFCVTYFYHLSCPQSEKLASMNPNKVTRENLKTLTDLPNIGKAGEKDLNLLGIHQPEQLVGKCPYEMYYSLCFATGESHDPCVIDVFISITRFMKGENPLPWWKYTQERKNYLNK